MNFEGLISSLARLSAQASLLVVLVLLVQRAFKNQLSAQWRCALVAASCAEASSAGQS